MKTPKFNSMVGKTTVSLAILTAISAGSLDANTAQARGLIAAHAGGAAMERSVGIRGAGMERGRALLPMGRLQGGGLGYYGLNPYFNKDNPLTQRKIFNMQKRYIHDWNHSLARPNDQKPGYKSGYEANGGHHLVTMYKKLLNGDFRGKNGQIHQMPKTPAPVFHKVLDNVNHHPNRTVKVKSPRQVVNQMKHNEKRRKMRNR